jgi:hypothetical protein
MSWKVREPEISFAGALCRLTSADFLYVGWFSVQLPGEIGGIPPKISPVALFYYRCAG